MKVKSKNLIEEEIDDLIGMLKAYMELFDELHEYYHSIRWWRLIRRLRALEQMHEVTVVYQHYLKDKGLLDD